MLKFDDPNKRAIVDYVIKAGWEKMREWACVSCAFHLGCKIAEHQSQKAKRNDCDKFYNALEYVYH